MEDDVDSGPGALSLGFVEDQYERYRADPGSVGPDWREYFGAISGDAGAAIGEPGARPRGATALRRVTGARSGDDVASAVSHDVATDLAPGAYDAAVRQDRLDQLVRAFRVRGHMIADVDPLRLPRPHQPELDPEFYGFGANDLDRTFSARTLYFDGAVPLRRILERLHATYCRSIGVQFMHIDDLAVKSWLQERMERTENRSQLNRPEQLRILTKLTDAVIFEEFIQKKFLGAKRFSLEGSESLIPLLMFAIDRAAEYGVDEIVLGMAHRGRLNVLANIMGKSPRLIFKEFEDDDPEAHLGSGDVKYHLGYSSDWTTANGRVVHLSLSFNPSHLEFVNPVVLGRTRAKQDRAGDLERERKIPILVHGDAAFAGEGVVQETLTLSQLRGYTIGGTVHVVVNNQIGFTTTPSEARSSTYATDVAKMLQIPIFHVNGEDPEAVAQVIRMAMDFRERFRQDVVIDMYGYRRHGHNETDEPSFTQPLLYQAIAARKSVRDGYLENLLRLGQVTQEEADQIAVDRRDHLEQELSQARRKDFRVVADAGGGHWEGYLGGREERAPVVDTGVPRIRTARLLERLARVPEDFHVHRTLQRLLAQRRQMARGERPLDWGAAEHLAFATLLTEGVRVRLSGQDSERGTFSHRHSVFHDVENGSRYVPLANLSPDQAGLEVINSPLSEAGVMGFEYGYSLDRPEALVLWEAQFGDFVNVAQVIIDQFLVSAEDKWSRLSGLTLLLPHGFEGAGPEHSSARIERFLMLAAEHNIQIVQPSTPANFFHVLRRQVLRPWRKPLVVFTPKSLLRHPSAVSSLEELAQGTFQKLIGDPAVDPATASRVFLCSGRVYYDLLQRREALGRMDVAIVRMEQFYPLEPAELEQVLGVYRDETPIVWVQDEPANMGAGPHLRGRFLGRVLGRFPFSIVCREESASPATGSGSAHKLEQQRLLAEAFAP